MIKYEYVILKRKNGKWVLSVQGSLAVKYGHLMDNAYERLVEDGWSLAVQEGDRLYMRRRVV
mgnify:CR=1 FL=1